MSLWVGVFAGHRPEEIAELARNLELAAVQLHGSEAVSEVKRVRGLVPAPCEVWKAVRDYVALWDPSHPSLRRRRGRMRG